MFTEDDINYILENFLNYHKLLGICYRTNVTKMTNYAS